MSGSAPAVSKKSHEAPPLSTTDFRTLRELILDKTGISLADSKRDLVRGRLRKRLSHLNISNFREYLDLVQHRDPQGTEFNELVNAVTTNKTDFFRENHHFEFLRGRVFPECQAIARSTGKKKLRIWSAACSTGEEPYTIAYTCNDFFQPGWNIRILASDIDSNVLRTASEGVYRDDRIEGIPVERKKQMFLKGKGSSAGTVRVRPELRDLITFRRINFAEPSWTIKTKFDVIFCRNVLIYFDRNFQDRLIRRFMRYLEPHGYLILGHSENITWIKELESLGKTIYRPQSSENISLPKPPTNATEPVTVPTPATKAKPDATAAAPTPAPERFTAPPKKERLKKHPIVAGEFFASNKHMEISTLLGSCIAACLYDPTVKAGGMNHFLLPEGSGENADTACYGINAMELLINEIMILGGQRERMVAKLFGGARVMSDQLSSSRVGEKNVAFVRKYLTEEGIPILEQKVGGNAALRVVMTADNGEVQATELETSHGRKLINEDQKVLKQANTEAKVEEDDKIVLF